MAQITNHIENFKMNINEDFVRKAQELEPALHYKTVRPAQLVSFQPSDAPDKPNGWDLPVHNRADRVFDWIPCRMQPVEALDTMPLSKGSSVCLDFGTHHVGYISFRLTLRPIYGLSWGKCPVKLWRTPHPTGAPSAAAGSRRNTFILMSCRPESLCPGGTLSATWN